MTVFHLSSGVQLRHERQAEEPGVEHHHVDVSVHRSGSARVSVLCGVVRSDPVPSHRGKDPAQTHSLSECRCSETVTIEFSPGLHYKS